jgi:hypothetical protein
MHHCLTKEELRELIESRRDDRSITNETLQLWVNSAEGWNDELAGLNYLVSHILERNKKRGDSTEGILDVFFALDQRMAIVLQPFDFRFIDFMLRTVRNATLSLEDELIALQDDVGEYRYDRTLRFGHNLTDLSL